MDYFRNLAYCIAMAATLSCGPVAQQPDGMSQLTERSKSMNIAQLRAERLRRNDAVLINAIRQELGVSICGRVLTRKDWQQLRGSSRADGSLGGSVDGAFLFGFGSVDGHVKGSYTSSGDLSQESYLALGLKSGERIIGLKVRSDAVPVEALAAAIDATLQEYGSATVCFPATNRGFAGKTPVTYPETYFTPQTSYGMKGASRISVGK